MLHPFVGNNSQGYAPCGVICLHVDDLFMCGNTEFSERVLKRLRKDYTIGSEDIDDIAFVGQRIRWIKASGASAPHIQVDQQLAVDDLHEIVFDLSRMTFCAHLFFIQNIGQC